MQYILIMHASLSRYRYYNEKQELYSLCFEKSELKYKKDKQNTGPSKLLLAWPTLNEASDEKKSYFHLPHQADVPVLEACDLHCSAGLFSPASIFQWIYNHKTLFN